MPGKEILVAGGGPAGLSCAYWASREGYEVTVFERERKLGVKPCGEFIPRETLRYTPFTKRANWILNRIRRGLVYYKNEFIRELRIPAFKGYTIDKPAFLEDLAAEARALGATIRLNETFTCRHLKGSGLSLVVDATGCARCLARRAGLNYRGQRLALTLQGYCKGSLDQDSVILNLSDRGYAWLIPHGDLVNFGVGGFYSKRKLEQTFEENLKLFGLKLTKGNLKPRASAVLVGGPIRRLVRGKLIVAGEAAGAVMSTTGEGIRFALWSGSICFKPRYGQQFWRGYGERLRFGGKLLELTTRLTDEERLEILRRGSPKLHESLIEGLRPGVRDVVAMPWLLPYLRKLYAKRG